MEDITQYDKFINIAIWVAVGGLILSGFAVGVFRFYTSKKNGLISAIAANERHGISSKMDTLYDNTVDQINAKRKSINRKLESEASAILSELSTKSKSALNAIETLRKESNTASREIANEVNKIKNANEQNKINKQYEISLEDIKFDLIFERINIGRPDLDKIKASLPESFNVKSALLGDFHFAINFKGSLNENEHVGKRTVSYHFVYTSTPTFPFTNSFSNSEDFKIRKFPYKYVWDLNDSRVRISLPQKVTIFLTMHNEWKARVQISCNGVKIAESNAIEISAPYTPWYFDFTIEGLDEQKIKSKLISSK
jgi:hypothetical protein